MSFEDRSRDLHTIDASDQPASCDREVRCADNKSGRGSVLSHLPAQFTHD